MKICLKGCDPQKNTCACRWSLWMSLACGSGRLLLLPSNTGSVQWHLRTLAWKMDSRMYADWKLSSQEPARVKGGHSQLPLLSFFPAQHSSCTAHSLILQLPWVFIEIRDFQMSASRLTENQPWTGKTKKDTTKQYHSFEYYFKTNCFLISLAFGYNFYWVFLCICWVSRFQAVSPPRWNLMLDY